jgi:hypothetical protein
MSYKLGCDLSCKLSCELSRKLRAAVAVLIACAVGTVPGCGTMGGGMRYFAPDASWSAMTSA